MKPKVITFDYDDNDHTDCLLIYATKEDDILNIKLDFWEYGTELLYSTTISFPNIILAECFINDFSLESAIRHVNSFF